VVRVPTHDEGGQARANRKSEDAAEVEQTAEAASEVAERKAKLTEDVDDLLDEIDDVLESNAEDFVRGYVQKGGE
jgi:ubiquitin-like protein Pup